MDDGDRPKAAAGTFEGDDDLSKWKGVREPERNDKEPILNQLLVKSAGNFEGGGGHDDPVVRSSFLPAPAAVTDDDRRRLPSRSERASGFLLRGPDRARAR